MSEPVSAIVAVSIVAAILGCALVTGLLFAFSNFVMRALGELPVEQGMFAMQRINVAIINPLFLVLFLGTPILCIAIAINALVLMSDPASWWLLAGAIAYLLGPFAITMLRNVPLNNQLAAAPVEEAATIWPAYRNRWQYWNHIRTLIGVVATVLLSVGAGQLGF